MSLAGVAIRQKQSSSSGPDDATNNRPVLLLAWYDRHRRKLPWRAEAGARAWATIEVPAVDTLMAPLVYALPVQLLAYHTAVAKGTDVDQPRNLAKSVTVE